MHGAMGESTALLGAPRHAAWVVMCPLFPSSGRLVPSSALREPLHL